MFLSISWQHIRGLYIFIYIIYVDPQRGDKWMGRRVPFNPEPGLLVTGYALEENCWNLQITHSRNMIFQTSRELCSMLIFRVHVLFSIHLQVMKHHRTNDKNCHRIRGVQLPEGRGARGAASLRFFMENLVGSSQESMDGGRPNASCKWSYYITPNIPVSFLKIYRKNINKPKIFKVGPLSVFKNGTFLTPRNGRKYVGHWELFHPTNMGVISPHLLLVGSHLAGVWQAWACWMSFEDMENVAVHKNRGDGRVMVFKMCLRGLLPLFFPKTRKSSNWGIHIMPFGVDSY